MTRRLARAPQHNAEVEACDLLMEVDRLPDILKVRRRPNTPSPPFRELPRRGSTLTPKERDPREGAPGSSSGLSRAHVRTTQYADDTNFTRIGIYLQSCASYLPEPEDTQARPRPRLLGGLRARLSARRGAGRQTRQKMQTRGWLRA